ncbi:MAG TPA: PQQ-binding-like beta-propeller repeat protein [Pirellulales bacterium]|nr:PQQ-binding-like beta-propeller repeat protein [Pirellulales bacterium]
MKHGRHPFRPPSGAATLSAVVLAAAVLELLQPSASGQVRQGNRRLFVPNAQGENSAEEATDSVFYPPDRDLLQRLARARELIAEKRYGEAARFLSSILESAEDYFFQPDRGQPVYRSLKYEAQRLIGELGDEGRASYELQYGAEARRLLDEAVTRGDRAGLAEVARKYFHTEAGYEATYLLGLTEMQRGQPLAAALCLERLRSSPQAAKLEPTLTAVTAVCWFRAGRSEQAAGLARELRQKFPGAEFEIGGKQKKIFSADAQAAAWLAEAAGSLDDSALPAGLRQWTLYRGGAARNAASEGSSPLLNRRWAVPVADAKDLEEMTGKIYQEYLERGSRVLPALHPLAVQDFVLMRSLTCLQGVDFRTGKRIWVSDDRTVGDVVANLPRLPGQAAATPVANWLQQRIWDNTIYGTLASDGDYVFCVDDAYLRERTANADVDNVEQGHVRQFNFANRPFPLQAAQQATNELRAYEIASQGKLMWVSEEEPALAGSFFLGPPLPVGGSLYVLAETKGEIRLFVLNPRTGAVEWSQQLVVIEPNVLEDHLRHLSGATPSFSDGILVCPTSAGAIVALDLTTRSLLWGFQYPKAVDLNLPMNRMFQFRFQQMPQINDPSDNDHWSDGSVTLAEGHAIFTPVESSEIYCVALTDGKLKWQKPREDGLYVACVHDGKVIVVGSRTLKALRLTDGESGWSEASLALPSNATPSGRGFYNRDRYYLPLSSAEVAAIDLADGRIVARSRSRSGTVPGNLICYHGAVISQGVDQVESYYQLDELREEVAKTLADHPDDAQALARQGELLLDEGRFDEAVKELRRSHEVAGDRRTRELLVDAMLESLRLDFAAHRGLAAEIEQLAEQPAQRATLLRLMAVGLQKNGQLVPAFEAYLKMVDLAAEPGPPERVDSGLSVRRDRWVRARLADLQAAASVDQRQQIDATLQKLLAECTDSNDRQRLRNFVLYFGFHRLADAARERLAALALQADPPVWIEAEHWLRQLERSEDPARLRTAAAGLARLFAQAGRPADAAPYFSQLKEKWSDEVCLDGKTGREIAAEVDKDGQVARYVSDEDTWPKGKVDFKKETGHALPHMRSAPIELRGSPGKFFRRSTVEIDTNVQQQTLVGRDGLGREQWRLSIKDANEANNFGFSANYLRTDGHLILMSLGFRLVAIDTLGFPSTRARVLWHQDLNEPLAGLPRNIGINFRPMPMPWGGGQRLQAFDVNGRPMGNTSPMSSEFVAFQRGRNLVAADPLNKEMFWTRQDIPSGSELFGDEELLFVVPALPANASEATVYRTLDGEALGRREIPSGEQRMLTLGRQVLAWETGGDGPGMLRLVDVWKQEEIWSRKFDARARFWPVADEALAVMEPSGHLTVLSLPEGNATIDADLDKEPALADIYFLRSPQVDVLITNRSTAPRGNVNIAAMPGQAGVGVLINGAAYGFDRRTGERLFKHPLSQKGLLMGQAAELPVIVFAATMQRPRGQQPAKGELACLDKRTGRMVFQQDMEPTNMVDVVCDPDAHEVTLKTQSTSYRLKFTDEPLDPPPAADKTEKKTSAAIGAGRAVSRVFRRLLGGSGKLDEDAAQKQVPVPRIAP